MTRPPVEIADVVRQYGADYLARYGAVTSTAQRRAIGTALSAKGVPKPPGWRRGSGSYSRCRTAMWSLPSPRR